MISTRLETSSLSYSAELDFLIHSAGRGLTFFHRNFSYAAGISLSYCCAASMNIYVSIGRISEKGASAII